MFARLTTTHIGKGGGDDVSAVLAELLPTLRGLDGFKGMIVASEVKRPRIIALSLWESEDALAASSATMDRLRDAESLNRGVESQETSTFRVVGFDLAD